MLALLSDALYTPEIFEVSFANLVEIDGSECSCTVVTIFRAARQPIAY